MDDQLKREIVARQEADAALQGSNRRVQALEESLRIRDERAAAAKSLAEAALAERMHLLALNACVGVALVEGASLAEILKRCAQAMVVELNGALARIWTLEPGENILELQASAGLYTHLDGNHSRIAVGEFKVGRIARERQPLLTNSVQTDPSVSDHEWAAREGIVAFAGYPLIVRDRVVGVLGMFARHTLSQATLEALASIANSIASGIDRKHTEEKLRHGQQELADFFDNATIGLHLVGPDGTILRANQAELDLLGYHHDEYVGHSITEFHADDEVIRDILKRLGSGEKLKDYPARLRCKDGAVKEVVIDSSVKWEKGKFVHTRCFTRDVTERKRAESAMRESEERFHLLADTVPQLAWIARADGHIFWYNRQWHDYTGTTPEQMEGWGWQSVHDADMLPQVLERWRASIATGEPFEMVFPLKSAQGPFRSFLTRVNPLRGVDSRVLCWFGTNTDITEIKQMEEAVRASEQRLRHLADAMPQIVWTAAADGNIDFINRQWTEFTGLPQAIGNAGWQKIIHPEDIPTSNQKWAESLRAGKPFEMEIRLFDRRAQAHRWHLIRAVCSRDESGKATRWYGTSTDIHQQKRAGETAKFLAEASTALATLVDYESTLQTVANLAVPYFADWSAVDVVNDDGTLRRLAVAHLKPSKMRLAQELLDRYPPDLNAPQGVGEILRSRTPIIVEEITDDMLVLGAEDEEHLRMIRALELKSYICVPLIVSDKALGVLTFATAESGRAYDRSDLALAQDLAQRTRIAIENSQLYSQLREADRRKDEFLATLAHELRNPLAPIRNSLQILKMPRVDAEAAERSREMMERQVQHLVRLVDDLLDVSRVMRGKIELRKERVELATIVARAVEIAQPIIEAQAHDLTVSLPTESIPLDADPVRLAQVLGNLLTNAAKYTEANGKIRLAAKTDSGQAIIRVSDTGIGIAPDMLPRIFELFVQVDHAATRSQGGLGIGLTLVRNLVGMHNGSVEVHSEGLGRGSEFVVRLPIATSKISAGTASDDGPALQPVPFSGRRLMVVDDNRDAADSLAMLLRMKGHEVRVAHDGHSALKLADGYLPELVFLDLGMPGMDGFEVARRLRHRQGLEKLRLAALTGWGQLEDRRRTADAGFDYHLVKPVEPHAVEELLASLRPQVQPGG